jgi:hypothetical protein
MGDISDVFKSIAAQLEDKERLIKRRSLACQQVIDDIIRPTIVQASNDIKNPNAIFYPYDNQPRVTVGEMSGILPDELRFECHGGSVKITTVFNGGEGSVIIPIPEMSIEMVAQKVKSFLRDAFDLPLDRQ